MSGMKASLSDPQAEVEARAREWFIRLLDEDVGREELLAWEQWLDADERRRAAYERVDAAWRRMQAVEVKAPTAQELAEDRYLAHMTVALWRQGSRPRLKLVWSMAAGLVAILAVATTGWIWHAAHAPAPQQFATERARHMDARLQDGSRIQLGALTTLNVAYSAARRDANLVRGEALFHVAHDRHRPFVVQTPLAAITAVGTAFDIDIDTGAVILTVTEGVVSVSPDPAVGAVLEDSGSAIRVHAGQRLRMERNGSRLIFALGDSGSGATWTQGRLEYRNVDLQSVIDDVNRYSTQPIVAADVDLANLRYTGAVQLQDADTWVLGLPAAFPLSVEMNDHGQFVLRQKATGSASSDNGPPGRRGRPSQKSADQHES